MADRDTVMFCVVKPMMAIYRVPKHIAGSKDRQKKVGEFYIQKLEPFSNKTVEIAAERVFSSHMFWDWPTPGAFVSECNTIEN